MKMMMMSIMTLIKATIAEVSMETLVQHQPGKVLMAL
jgi:hypothetical protein